MKSVLISINPRWCGLIADGKKTLEIRKSRPNLKPPFKCYIYCTNGKPFLNSRNGQVYISKEDVLGNLGYGLYHRLNGKIIGEFICSDIDRLGCVGSFDGAMKVIWIGIYDRSNSYWKNFDPSPSCLNDEQVNRYLSGKDGFAWHIADMKIYDNPKDISAFYKCGTLSESDFEYSIYDGSGDPARNSYASYLFTRKVRRPPQSWCYVEEMEDKP